MEEGKQQMQRWMGDEARECATPAAVGAGEPALRPPSGSREPTSSRRQGPQAGADAGTPVAVGAARAVARTIAGAVCAGGRAAAVAGSGGPRAAA